MIEVHSGDRLRCISYSIRTGTYVLAGATTIVYSRVVRVEVSTTRITVVPSDPRIRAADMTPVSDEVVMIDQGFAEDRQLGNVVTY